VASRSSRREQREQSRADILAAARTLLSAGPYRAFSVAAVMERTGLTRPAFYKHFPDVSSLLAALLADVGEELRAAGARWAAAPAVGVATARRHLTDLVATFAEHAELLRALLEASHHDARIAALRSAWVDTLVADMREALDERVAAGALAPLDAEQVARAMVLMLEQYLLYALAGRERVEQGRVVDTVWLIWTRTIGVADDVEIDAAG